MIDGVLDALAQRLGHACYSFRAERAANGVSAEGTVQSGDFQPPLAKIDDAMQSGLVVGELAFVNNEAGFVFAFEDLRDDLIEGNAFHFDSRSEQFQRRVGRRELAGYRDFLLLDFIRRERRVETSMGP